MNVQLSDFGQALLFIIGGTIFALGGLFTARMVRPNRPNEEKNTIYESGEDTVGNAWGNFNIRFFIIALVFILFEVEIAFLFPWATVFADEQLMNETNNVWGWFTIFEAVVFILILVVGLVYVWAQGFLDWEKPELKTGKTVFKAPNELYQNLNNKYKPQ
jgi:NADH-quinone oxidoreductase subunit A